MNKALFLDRDGILNIDKGYVYKYEDIEWIEDTFKIIEWANQNSYLVIVLTNQTGVFRKFYTEQDVQNLHNKMSEYLKSLNLKIDDWFYCLDYDPLRRKPKPGMMLEAKNKYNIDLNESIMIGDKLSDRLNIEGPKYYLVQGNYSLDSLQTSKNTIKVKTIIEILNDIKENKNEI